MVPPRALGAAPARSVARTSWKLLTLLLSTLAAGCGDDAVVSGTGTGTDDDGPSDECNPDSCPSFVAYCTDGVGHVVSGCQYLDPSLGPDGGYRCAIEEDAAAACGGNPDHIVTFPPGEDPVLDGPGPGASTCEENAVISHLPPLAGEVLFDCTCDAKTCVSDASPEGDADCVDPVAGDPCFETDALGCADLGASALYCNAGTWEATDLECLDSAGYCFSSFCGQHDQFSCGAFERFRDYSIAGNSCSLEGDWACSFDRTVVHRCEGGEWNEVVHCGGPECTLYGTVEGEYYACRNGGYSVGDPCDFEGKVVCSNDLASVLMCEDGELSTSVSCGGGQACREVNQGGNEVLVCASAAYVVGDLCFFPDGYTTCSGDGSQILRCDDGTMELEESCGSPGSCAESVDDGLTVVTCD